MTLANLLSQAYIWLDANAVALLLGGLVFAAIGTGAAWIGRGGRTDRDGRYIAGVTIGVGATALVVEVIAILLAWAAFDASVLDASVVLLLAPVLCLAACMVGIHMVFPLNELASVKALLDIVWFAAAAAALLWMLSKFRGWGILFGGGLLELTVIAALAYFVLRRLYRRAFSSRR